MLARQEVEENDMVPLSLGILPPAVGSGQKWY